MTNNEFKVEKGKQPIYSVVKILMRMIFRKPKIINLAGEIESKSIILANHSAKSGPPSLDLYFPKKAYKWGAYEMFGTFKERKAYLRDILYIKKCGKKPGFATSFKASFMAIFSKGIYKGMRMMPTYPDSRLKTTIKNSISVIEEDVPVMIFPENSNEGYKTVLTEFFPGFAMLAERYYRKNGVDLPIYPVYYSIPKRLMVIGKPIYMQELIAKGMKRDAICDYYKNAVNALYFEYVENA